MLDEKVSVPELGPPRGHDQHETCLEEVRGEQDAGHERDTHPPVWTRVSRSARSDTSLYSPVSARSSRKTASARAVSPDSSSATPRSYRSACPSSALGAGAS